MFCRPKDERENGAKAETSSCCLDERWSGQQSHQEEELHPLELHDRKPEDSEPPREIEEESLKEID